MRRTHSYSWLDEACEQPTQGTSPPESRILWLPCLCICSRCVLAEVCKQPFEGVAWSWLRLRLLSFTSDRMQKASVRMAQHSQELCFQRAPPVGPLGCKACNATTGCESRCAGVLGWGHALLSQLKEASQDHSTSQAGCCLAEAWQRGSACKCSAGCDASLAWEKATSLAAELQLCVYSSDQVHPPSDRLIWTVQWDQLCKIGSCFIDCQWDCIK